MQRSVKEDREKWIGGSDIPALMGINPFKTRWSLLLEKAEIIPINTNFENEYTNYGNEMESKIRDYLNFETAYEFTETSKTWKDIRYHADGHDKATNTLLEIKTTSDIKDELSQYKRYLVQLLTGMIVYGSNNGVLAVYQRPEDFSEEFNPDNLDVFAIEFDSQQELVNEIDNALESFRSDLIYLKENKDATEEDLPSRNELVPLANRLAQLEADLVGFKSLEAEYKAVKDKLKEQMEERGIKSWELNNGTKLTVIPDGEDKEVYVFDEAKFKEEAPATWAKFITSKTKKGRKGYLRITLK